MEFERATQEEKNRKGVKRTGMESEAATESFIFRRYSAYAATTCILFTYLCVQIIDD